MNNTSLLRITATAGTQLVKTRYIYCHYQYINKASFNSNIIFSYGTASPMVL